MSYSRWRKRCWKSLAPSRFDYTAPVPKRAINLRRVTLAAHVILTDYGHWLPNEIRGSVSEEIRKEELKQLGGIHHGRKRVQPSRKELREFHEQADSLLEYPVLWYDETMRTAIGEAFDRVIQERGYTCWACAILRDHAHLLIRNHKDHAEEMWYRLAEASKSSLRAIATVPNDHPIWCSRPYSVLLFSRPEVITRVPYIEGNPQKHGLPDQEWGFVSKCPWL
jgi:hypothetical protein